MRYLISLIAVISIALNVYSYNELGNKEAFHLCHLDTVYVDVSALTLDDIKDTDKKCRELMSEIKSRVSILERYNTYDYLRQVR